MKAGTLFRLVAALLVLFGQPSVFAQELEGSGLRLGPVPPDQRSVDRGRGRSLDVPLVQQDAAAFVRSGERLLRLQPRIVGGAPVPIGAYPWQVSIGLADVPTSRGHFCGGAVIAEQWIVTAAHCVDGTTVPEGLQIVGTTNFLSQPGVTVEVADIIVHESWDSLSFDYDVALIKTSQAIETTPIKLVTHDTATELVPVGVLGTVSGWGFTSEGGRISDVLQHVGVQITSNEICNGATAYPGQITDRMVCAGFAEGGRDSCQGDSGGPFMVFDRKGGYALAGIVSWGEGCARPNKFGVYTRVSTVADWINEKLGGG